MSTYTKGQDEDTDEALLETFKRWFKQVLEVEAEQREREIEDLRFQVDAWDERARAERRGKDGLPGQPTLHVSLIKQPMQLVKNQAQAADLGIEIHPVSETAEKETAATMQDHYRTIERDSNAEQVRLWAFDRGLQCGRGYWRVDMVYDQDSEHEYDQKIVIKRVLDGSMVGFDPSARELDYSDARYAFAWGWVSWEQFCEDYPDDPLVDYDEAQFSSLAMQEPDWVQGEGDDKAVLVAEVWRKKTKRTHICYVKEGREFVSVPKDEVGRRKIFAEKDREEVTLCWYKICGTRILDQEEWPAEYRGGKKIKDGLSLIPLVPFIATELQAFDGERRFEGMVRPARQGQNTFDYAISSAVADVGRLSKIPYIGPAGSFAGHEAKWNSANIKPWAYIEYNVVGPDGQQIPPPQPMQVDGQKLGLSLQLAEMAKGLVQSSTATYDPSLGETPKRGQSGRAVIAQQQQSDAGTSHYLQVLANIAMRYEARCVLERMVYGYDRPGRVVSLRGAEDELKQVMLNAPYKPGDDGRPVRARPGEQGAKVIDYRTGGKYGVAISVGKSYQTRLQQGQEQFGELLPNLPPELQVLLLPTYMRFRDSPGSKEAADLMAKFRDSKFPGLVDDKESGPTPEQLKAELAGTKQQMEQMGQQLQMAVQKIETDVAKQDAAKFKAQLDAQTAQMSKMMDVKIAEMNNAAKINVAQIAAETAGNKQASEGQTEAMALAATQGYDAEQAERDRLHETATHREEMAHEVGLAAAGGNKMTRTREGGSETGQEETNETSDGASRTPRDVTEEGGE